MFALYVNYQDILQKNAYLLKIFVMNAEIKGIWLKNAKLE